MDQAHATTVEIRGIGVMLMGPSGSGKSDLALRLIDQGARLVADDRTHIMVDDGQLIATAPHTIAGQLEVRGFGVVEVPRTTAAPVRLIAELVHSNQVERLPDPGYMPLLGVSIPLIMLNAFEASAAAKLRLVLKQVGNG